MASLLGGLSSQRSVGCRKKGVGENPQIRKSGIFRDNDGGRGVQAQNKKQGTAVYMPPVDLAQPRAMERRSDGWPAERPWRGQERLYGKVDGRQQERPMNLEEIKEELRL